MASEPEHPPRAEAEPAEVLDAVPYGVVVLDERRCVTRANSAGVKLLWDLERGGPPVHCHELFACRAPGGPCEHGCLAERAARSPDPLPEIRIDTPARGPSAALWVTAAGLPSARGVVLHLRPGDARDRRRRSDLHWLNGPELRITALGRTWVDSRETPIGGQWLQQRPGQLLKHLVCERNRVVHAEEIAEALWPGGGRQSLGNVRHFMHALRQKLEPGREPGAPSSFIVTVQGGYALDRRNVRIDADLFEEGVAAGLNHARTGQDDRALARLEDALALYRGDLVADEPYAEWAQAERDRLHSLAAHALRTATRLLLERADPARAASALERLCELEPFDAAAHRELFAVWLGQGRRSEAVRRYGAFRARLQREFGDSPDFALADIAPLEPRA
jgi:DNA-binding SARP family transcriptional activator